jgi:hypothetical protein
MQNDTEKAIPDPDIHKKTPHDPQSPTTSDLGDKPDNVAKPQDDGPPDGGTTVWLVLLGAWCCSFSSPGWTNSKY